jgi:hypothetical protein
VLPAADDLDAVRSALLARGAAVVDRSAAEVVRVDGGIRMPPK